MRDFSAARARQIVAHDEFALGLDAGEQLVELQTEQPAVGAELDDVALDFTRDATHHLKALGHRGCVAHGDEVFDLERR